MGEYGSEYFKVLDSTANYQNDSSVRVRWRVRVLYNANSIIDTHFLYWSKKVSQHTPVDAKDDRSLRCAPSEDDVRL